MNATRAERLWSFRLALVVNGLNAGLNLAYIGLHLWKHEAAGAQVSGAIVVATVIVAWGLIIFERRAHLQIETAESYLLEQNLDTELKRLMVEHFRKGGRLSELDTTGKAATH